MGGELSAMSLPSPDLAASASGQVLLGENPGWWGAALQLAVLAGLLAGLGLLALLARPSHSTDVSDEPRNPNVASAPSVALLSAGALRQHLIVVVDGTASARRLQARFAGGRLALDAGSAPSPGLTVEFVSIESERELETLLMGLSEARTVCLPDGCPEITVVDIRGE